MVKETWPSRAGCTARETWLVILSHTSVDHVFCRETRCEARLARAHTEVLVQLTHDRQEVPVHALANRRGPD